MSTAQTIEKPLLRPHQIEDMNEELSNIEKTLNAPPHVRSKITDQRQFMQRRERLRKQLADETPREFSVVEKDSAVAEYKMLAETIQADMPSSEEMRRNPPGAREMQTAWHEKHKRNVQRYKNLGLRLRAGGDLPERLLNGSNAANIEMLRPLTRGARQLPMDGAQIPKKRDIHVGAADSVVFSESELLLLEQRHPILYQQLALLPAEAREALKADLAASLSQKAKPQKNAERQARHAASEIGRLIAAAKANGIKCWGAKKDVLMAELTAKGIKW